MEHDYEPLEIKELKLPLPLRRYQWNGVRFLIERESALLADGMGLGKTVQVAVALSLLFRKKDVNRALVVTPASLRLNWERELSKWSQNLSVQKVQGDSKDRVAFYRLPFNVLIASYDQIRMDSLTINKEINFDVVVLDEAQRIKNLSSKTTLACRMLQRKRSWALTGTPLENNVADLVSIFRFVRQGLLYRGLPRTEVHSRIKPFFLRRTKEDVFTELPPIFIQEIPLELSKKQIDAYGITFNERYKAKSEGELLSLITKLKQICNFEPSSGESSKLEALTLSLEGLNLNTDKIIIYSQYVKTLNWLSTKLKYVINFEIYHGGLTEKEKDEVLSRFRLKDGPRALLVSLIAGATGLNLQEASTVIFFDRWWNPAVENQALYRAYRFQRERPLFVIKYLIVNTIEEKIQTILQEKGILFDQYINQAESVSIKPFSGNELRRILDIP